MKAKIFLVRTAIEDERPVNRPGEQIGSLELLGDITPDVFKMALANNHAVIVPDETAKTTKAPKTD